MNPLLSPEQRLILQDLALGDIPVPLRRRALLLLLCDEERSTAEVADSVGLSRRMVRHWRRMFIQRGMEIFPSNALEAEAANNPPGWDALPVEVDVTEPETVAMPPIPVETVQTQEDADGDEANPDPAAPRNLEAFIVQAAAMQSPGVLPDDSLAEAGRKVWLFQLGQMLMNFEGTRLGEDIEALHDMRVATRRMRAAFEVFGDAFDPKVMRPHLKRLRLAGRTLGKVRDLDVFIEKAHQYAGELPEAGRDGLQPLLEAWQAQRQTARVEMLAYLDGPKYRGFVDKFYRFLTAPEAAPVRWQEGVPQAWQVRDIAPQLIYTRLAAVRAFDAILDHASLEQFHALRIEFKKLRYTLEYFREVLGEETRLVIGEIKILQDHLGNLNDAQVATGILRDFLLTWDAAQAALTVAQRKSPEPVLAYLQYQYRQRQELMLSFRQTWVRFNNVDFRQKLAAAVAVL